MDNKKLSPRLSAIVDALPLYSGIRVLEIGCGPGAAAREIARRIGEGYVLGIDRSTKAIQQAVKVSGILLDSGRIEFRRASVEDFYLEETDSLFNLAFAVRVGVLDGRHKEQERKAIETIFKVLKPGGQLFIDSGNSLKEISLNG